MYTLIRLDEWVPIATNAYDTNLRLLYLQKKGNTWVQRPNITKLIDVRVNFCNSKQRVLNFWASGTTVRSLFLYLMLFQVPSFDSGYFLRVFCIYFEINHCTVIVLQSCFCCLVLQ